MLEKVLSIVPMVDVPPIAPQWDAPWLGAAQVLVSWILATCLLVVLGILIVSVASLALKGLFPEKIRSWAGENIVTVIIAAIVLGSISGIFQFFVNFNLGF